MDKGEADILQREAVPAETEGAVQDKSGHPAAAPPDPPQTGAFVPHPQLLAGG